MNGWRDFYYLCGSSAATLTGLMFIGVTFGSRLITVEKLPYVDAFISPIAFHFIQVFFLCCVASASTVTPQILGACIAFTGLWRLAQIPRTARRVKLASQENNDVETSDWVLGVYLPSAAYILLIVTGALYFFGRSGAPNLFAAALIGLLMIGVFGAWDMLIWIATKVD